jgi:hypothetical protein
MKGSSMANDSSMHLSASAPFNMLAPKPKRSSHEQHFARTKLKFFNSPLIPAPQEKILDLSEYELNYLHNLYARYEYFEKKLTSTTNTRKATHLKEILDSAKKSILDFERVLHNKKLAERNEVLNYGKSR